MFMSLFNIFKKTTKKSDKEKEQKDSKSVKAKVVKIKTEKQKDVKTQQEKIKKTEIKINKENYKDAYRILIRPISTEKATNILALNQYVFEVAKNSNKTEIKKAIQAVYNVKPLKINILKIKGKNVRHGKTKGKTKDWKKAIIILKQGEKIEVFEK